MDNMIGKRIKERRKALHLTQVQIKELCGISNGNLSDLENGNRLPSAGALVSLSQALGVTTDWLLTGDDKLGNISTRIYLKTEEEENLIKFFRQLDQDEREEILVLAELKLKKKLKRETKSSSSKNPDILNNNLNTNIISA